MAEYNSPSANVVYGLGQVFESHAGGVEELNLVARQTQLLTRRPTVVPWSLTRNQPNDIGKPSLARDWGYLARLRPYTPYPTIAYIEMGAPIQMGDVSAMHVTPVVSPPPVGMYYCGPEV